VLLKVKPCVRGLLAFALVLLATTYLHAQRTTGDMIGVVKDSSGAVLPGVTVSVTGPNIPRAQTAVTSETGSYRIANLPPGIYTVSFELAGFKGVTLQGLRVNVGGTLEQNVGLEIGQIAETVTVSGQSPIVDTTSSEVGTTFDKDWVENTPSRRYGFYDLVAQAPGSVKGGDGDIYSERRTMSFGSSFDENAFQLDGVNVTDNYWSEGFSDPNPDAVDEVEVLALGAPAEYGNLMGAVYNIVTKQGTNQFHGDASYFYQSDGLTSDNTKDVTFNGVPVDACGGDPAAGHCRWTRGDYFEVSATLGGPIVRDKLWFFGSYGHQKEQYTRVGVPVTAFPGSGQDNRKDRVMVKGTWQITPSQRLVGNFHMDKSPQDTGYDSYETPSTAWTRTQKAPTPGVAYTATLSNKTLLDVRYSGFYGSTTGYPSDPSQPLSQPRIINTVTGITSGANYYWYQYDVSRTTVTGKLSHHADRFLGAEHDFHFGVQYNQAGVNGVYGYNDLFYVYSYYGNVYGSATVRQPFSYAGTARNIGGFVDDAVRVGRLTLNLGVRYDHSHAFTPEQKELDANANPTGKTFPRQDWFSWDSVSPRLGANFKLTGDGKTVFKTHWGRYHPQITTGEFANIVGPNVKPYYLGNYDPDTGAITDLKLLTSNENLSISSSYTAPRTDQFILSVERELTPRMGLQVAYVRKWGRNYPAWRDTVGTYVPEQIIDNKGPDATGNTINIFRLTSDPGARKYELGNSDNEFTNINAFTANLSKRMTWWMGNLSATYLRSTGALLRGRTDSSIQQRGAFEFSKSGRDPNDYVNLDGRLLGDVGMQFKAQGVVRLPWGFQASASFDSRQNAHRVRTRSLPESVTGQLGTTILLQPRGDFGRLPDVKILDARLQKDFSLGRGARVSLFVDALNLNNENAAQSVKSVSVTSPNYQFPGGGPVPPGFITPRKFMLSAKFHF
jgi:hypothetical protein